MERVLLVEDSVDCQLLVRRALESSVKLEVAPDLATAKRMLAADRYDLLLLDVELPDGDGFGLCSSLVSESGSARPRIMFLTGSQKIGEKLTGFSVGGDDYITKPFNALELKARVQAHLRTHADLTKSRRRLRTGNLVLDLSCYTAEVDSDSGPIKVDLTPMEFRLLYALARNEPRVLSREQLLAAASSHGEESLDRTIDAHLCKLRKKLRGLTHVIESVYGVGYRLIKIK
jgi:two-component system alkaline phosphatase synthesis response regulator PhoP